VIALNNLAWVTGELGKDGAVDYAERAVKLAPNQPAILDTLAMLLAEKRDFARAIELEKKALELQPENTGLRLKLAKIYLKAGDKARAKSELEALAKGGEKLSVHAEVMELLKTL
jgi:predicted Zn-dependent protease